MRPEPTEPIARELRRRGLAAPALLLLEAHRPLQPLLGLAASFLLPVVRPLFGVGAVRVQAALEQEQRYDDLIARLRDEPDA